MKKTLFEFSVNEKNNIPRSKLLAIVEEEIKIESKHRNWTGGYEIIEVHFPIRQLDGSLRYTFRVMGNI